jgi:putative ABC transport system ATP-binding protein
LKVHDLRHEYDGESGIVHALRGVELNVARSEFVAIMGPSGSGKTTLLNCAAGLQRPTGGSVELAGSPLEDLGEAELARVRRRELGFVFQSFNLLPALSVIENVELPLRLDGKKPDREATLALLDRVGLVNRAMHRPDQLSGGQQQRAAIARALVTRPQIVFADEPTGALDIRSAHAVLTLLRGLSDQGQAMVMVTHDPVAAAFSNRALFLADGRVVSQLEAPDARAVAARMADLVESAEFSADQRGAR